MTKQRRVGTLHEVLTRAFQQAGGVAAAADILPGRTSKRLYDAANPDAEARHEARLTYDEARLLTRAGTGAVTAFAEDLAQQAGGAFVPGLDIANGPLGAIAAQFGREAGESLQEVFAALADGVMTPAEAEAALPNLRETMTAINRLFAEVGRVAEEGRRPSSA